MGKGTSMRVTDCVACLAEQREERRERRGREKGRRGERKQRQVWRPEHAHSTAVHREAHETRFTQHTPSAE